MKLNKDKSTETLQREKKYLKIAFEPPAQLICNQLEEIVDREQKNRRILTD